MSNDPKTLTIAQDGENYIPAVGKQNGYMAGNNTWGKGSFVIGKDFTQSITVNVDTFPVNTHIEWNWPDAAGPEWPYGYPEVIYGYTGNPNSGYAQPIQIKDLKEFTVKYEVDVGGNTNDFDVLIDMFPTVTADGNPFGNTGNAEVSFYPFWEAPAQNKGVVTWFKKSDPPFKAQVFMQKSLNAETGYYTTEIIIRPIEDVNSPFYDSIMSFFAQWGWFTQPPRQIMKATIDFKEIYDFLVAQGFINAELYIQNVQLGCEPQCPNQYNTPPHSGYMDIECFEVKWA